MKKETTKETLLNFNKKNNNYIEIIDIKNNENILVIDKLIKQIEFQCKDEFVNMITIYIEQLLNNVDTCNYDVDEIIILKKDILLNLINDKMNTFFNTEFNIHINNENGTFEIKLKNAEKIINIYEKNQLYYYLKEI